MTPTDSRPPINLTVLARRINSIPVLKAANQSVDDHAARQITALLSQRSSAVSNIDLRGNRIKHGGAESLGGMLKDDRKIHTLNLSNNQLGGKGVEALSNSLVSNKHLHTLHLAGNAMGDLGARSLALCLEVNKSLRSLNLQNNGISEVGGQALLTALARNATLQTLNVGGNAMTVKTQRLLESAVMGRRNGDMELNSSIQNNDIDVIQNSESKSPIGQPPITAQHNNPSRSQGARLPSVALPSLTVQENAASQPTATQGESLGTSLVAASSLNASKGSASKVQASVSPGKALSDQLPEGWTRHTDKRSGRIYYHHKQSGKSTWRMPTADATASDSSHSAKLSHSRESNQNAAHENEGRLAVSDLGMAPASGGVSLQINDLQNQSSQPEVMPSIERSADAQDIAGHIQRLASSGKLDNSILHPPTTRPPSPPSRISIADTEAYMNANNPKRPIAEEPSKTSTIPNNEISATQQNKNPSSEVTTFDTREGLSGSIPARHPSRSLQRTGPYPALLQTNASASPSKSEQKLQHGKDDKSLASVDEDSHLLSKAHRVWDCTGARGVGFLIASMNNELVVASMTRGGAAYLSGHVALGDQLVAAGATHFGSNSSSHNAVSDVLCGEPGSVIEVIVRHGPSAARKCILMRGSPEYLSNWNQRMELVQSLEARCASLEKQLDASKDERGRLDETTQKSIALLKSRVQAIAQQTDQQDEAWSNKLAESEQRVRDLMTQHSASKAQVAALTERLSVTESALQEAQSAREASEQRERTAIADSRSLLTKCDELAADLSAMRKQLSEVEFLKQEALAAASSASQALADSYVKSNGGQKVNQSVLQSEVSRKQADSAARIEAALDKMRSITSHASGARTLSSTQPSYFDTHIVRTDGNQTDSLESPAHSIRPTAHAAMGIGPLFQIPVPTSGNDDVPSSLNIGHAGHDDRRAEPLEDALVASMARQPRTAVSVQQSVDLHTDQGFQQGDRAARQNHVEDEEIARIRKSVRQNGLVPDSFLSQWNGHDSEEVDDSAPRQEIGPNLTQEPSSKPYAAGILHHSDYHSRANSMPRKVRFQERQSTASEQTLKMIQGQASAKAEREHEYSEDSSSESFSSMDQEPKAAKKPHHSKTRKPIYARSDHTSTLKIPPAPMSVPPPPPGSRQKIKSPVYSAQGSDRASRSTRRHRLEA